MKNYWDISQNYFETSFRIDFDQNNAKDLLIEILEKMVIVGKKEDLFFITDSTLENDKGEEFIAVYQAAYSENKEVRFKGIAQNLLWLLFAREKQFGGDKYDFYSSTKLSFYGARGLVTTQKVHDVKVIYPYLNPNRLKFIKSSENDIWDPIEIELNISEELGIQLLFSSGLGVWSKKINANKDDFLNNKDLNKDGLIDNSELYYKNVPKLKRFINQVAEPILEQGGRKIEYKGIGDFLNI